MFIKKHTAVLVILAIVLAILPGIVKGEVQHVFKVAVSACSDGEQTVARYVAKSWDMNGAGGINHQIDVSYQWKRGNTVSGYLPTNSGAFLDTTTPKREFTGTLTISPTVDLLRIQAVAHKWGDGNLGGQMVIAETEVDPCEESEPTSIATGTMTQTETSTVTPTPMDEATETPTAIATIVSVPTHTKTSTPTITTPVIILTVPATITPTVVATVVATVTPSPTSLEDTPNNLVDGEEPGRNSVWLPMITK